MKTHKVIFHIKELDNWNSLINNVKNLQKDMTDFQVDIIVLANGSAVRYFDSTNVVEKNIDDIQKLSESDVKFKACNNSLTYSGITEDQLYPFVEVVPAGVGELVRKQNEGYAYIYV